MAFCFSISGMEFWFFILVIGCVCASLPSVLKVMQMHGKKLPPGPPALPILGNFLWLLKSSKNFSTMEPVLRQLRAEYGPIVTLYLGSRPSIFITTHDVAHRALVQSGSALASRPPALETTRVFFSDQHTLSTAPYGSLWRLLRHNFMSFAHPSRSHLYSPGRRWALHILKDKLLSEAGRAVTAVYHFQFSFFCLTLYMCFGQKFEETLMREIEAAQRASISNFIKFNVFNFMPKVTKIVFHNLWKELVQIRRNQENVLLPLIRARQSEIKQPKDMDNKERDLPYIDTLLLLTLPSDDQRKFSDGELVSLCSEFINGATDTSTTTLQWVMANLVKHQDIQEKLLQEINTVVKAGDEIQEEDLKRMPYLKAVILETLRRHPPGHFILPHAAVEDTRFEGYDIPKNAMINFTVADMSRDPEVWENPMEFIPERFVSDGKATEFDIKGVREIKMMPFGAGRRVCPAITMAILHQQYFVANLIRDFKWTAQNDTDIDLSEKQDFTMVMKNPLRVHITLRTC